MKASRGISGFIGRTAKRNPILFSLISSIITGIFGIAVTCVLYDPLKAAYAGHNYLKVVEIKVDDMKNGTGTAENNIKELQGIDKVITEKKAGYLFSRKRYEECDATVHKLIGDYYYSLGGETGQIENIEMAIEEYLLSMNLLEKYKNDYPNDYLTVLVSLGTSYRQLSRYKNRLDNLNKSRSLLEKAIANDSIKNSEDEFIRASMGLGDVYLDYTTMNIVEDSYKRSEYYYSMVLSFIKDRDFRSAEEPCMNEYVKIKYEMALALISSSNYEYLDLDEVSRREDNLEKSIDYLREVSTYWTPEKCPENYTKTQYNLAWAYLHRSERPFDDLLNLDDIEKARKILERNIETIDKDTNPYLYIEFISGIADCHYYYYSIAHRLNRDGYDSLENAIEYKREALKELQDRKCNVTYEYAYCQYKLSGYLFELYRYKKDAYELNGKSNLRNESISALEEAIRGYENSLQILCSDDPGWCMRIKYDLGKAYIKLYSMTGIASYEKLGVEQYEDALELFATDYSGIMTSVMGLICMEDMAETIEEFMKADYYINDTHNSRAMKAARSLKILGDTYRRLSRYSFYAENEDIRYDFKALDSYQLCANLYDDNPFMEYYDSYQYSTFMSLIGDCCLGAFYINSRTANLRHALSCYSESLDYNYNDEVLRKYRKVGRLLRCL
jgi:hypothetical protein